MANPDVKSSVKLLNAILQTSLNQTEHNAISDVLEILNKMQDLLNILDAWEASK